METHTLGFIMQNLTKKLETELPTDDLFNAQLAPFNVQAGAFSITSSAESLLIEAYTGQFNVEIFADQQGLALVSLLLQTLSEQADKNTPFPYHFSLKNSGLADQAVSDVYVKTPLDFLVASYVFISAEHRLLNLNEIELLPTTLAPQPVRDVPNGFA